MTNKKLLSDFSTPEFEAKYTYSNSDLGANWTENATTFKVWAPTADKIYLNLYQSGTSGSDDKIESLEMIPSDNGTWTIEKEGNLNNIYYTYTTIIDNHSEEAVDPYAKTVGINGERGMVIDLSTTDPTDWDKDHHIPLEAPTDAVVYELHIRDLSSDSSSGLRNTGKFLAFTEKSSKNSYNQSTGLSHIKDLGVTHIQLLPSYDYATVDETSFDSEKYNWGYDPKNYNCPEGSYSTDPYHGAVRIKEYKEMVQAIHNEGLGVIMDVVYNHTFNTDFCFNKIVPGYFYRINKDGSYSNGSACGNDVASERSMVRKYIVDSVKYWAKEYHLDGFRFDLVGLLDVDTINEIRSAMDDINPDIILYGEGWTLNTSVTKEDTPLATQQNANLMPRFGHFSDNIRDTVKGSVFYAEEPGYINGIDGLNDKMKDCILGTQVWSPSPCQTINYTSCHDNYTLWDKIYLTNPKASEEDRIKRNLLAASIIFTSQGVPLIQAGEELLRSKENADGELEENSYNLPDSINSIKWNDKHKYESVYKYYQGLIKLRKQHNGLRMTDKSLVNKAITFIPYLDNNVIAYTINGSLSNDVSNQILVIYNPSDTEANICLPSGSWKVCVDDKQAGTDILRVIDNEIATVAPISCMVLIQGKSNEDDNYSCTDSVSTTELNKESHSLTKKIAIGAAIIGFITTAICIIKRKK